MALNALLTQIQSPTSTGAVSYSACVDPKALLALFTRRSSTGVASDAVIGVGLAVSTSSRFAFCSVIRDAQKNSDIWRRQAVDKFITIVNPDTGAVDAEADIASFDASGFTLNWTTASATQYRVGVLSLGGSAISLAEIKEFTSPTSTGSQTVTGLGATHKLIVPVGVASTVNTTGTASDAAALIFGWAAGAAQEASLGHNCLKASTHSNGHCQRTDACIALPNSSGTGFNLLADFTSFASGEFTLNWTNVLGTGFKFWALCLAGTFQVETFVNVTPTSVGVQDNALAFSPLAALMQTWSAAAGSSAQIEVAHTISAVTGTGSGESHCATFLDKYGVGSTQADTALELDQSLQCWLPGATPSKVVEAALDSFAGKVGLDFTTVAFSGCQYVGLALGDPVAAPTAAFQLAPPGAAPTGDQLIWELAP